MCIQTCVLSSDNACSRCIRTSQIHAKIKHTRIHLPQLNFALMPAWIGQTWQWKVIDYFLVFFFMRALLLRVKMWLCLFISFHNSVDSLWKMLAMRVICMCKLQLAVRQGVPFDLVWRRNFWLTGITWHNAYKWHSAHLFEVDSFSRMIFNIHSALWNMWGHI